MLPTDAASPSSVHLSARLSDFHPVKPVGIVLHQSIKGRQLIRVVTEKGAGIGLRGIDLGHHPIPLLLPAVGRDQELPELGLFIRKGVFLPLQNGGPEVFRKHWASRMIAKMQGLQAPLPESLVQMKPATAPMKQKIQGQIDQ